VTLAAGLLGVQTSCAGELEHPENFSFLRGGGDGGGEPPACVTQYFADTCGGACHGQDAALLDLVSPGVERRLVDQPSAADSVCGGRTLVATDGSESLLLQKLTTVPCGSKMPFGGSASEAELACIRGWIDGLGGGGNADADTDDGGT
jgi:hypothetical protein